MSEKAHIHNHQNELWERLTATLSEVDTVYTDLLHILREKQRAVISGDVKRLEGVVIEEQSLVEKGKTLKKVTKTRMQEILHDFGESSQEATLGRLTELIKKSPRAEGLFGQRLETLGERVRRNCELISMTNLEMGYLLNASISFVQAFVQVLLRAGDDSARTYGVNGVVDMVENHNRVVDCQI